MATQTLEFSAASGLTISCKLFAIGSDTVVDTQTATEKTNDVNRYSVDFVDVAAGTYRLNGFVGSDGGFANEVFDLTLTTATFQPRSESAGLDAAGVRSAVGLASANLDTQFSSIGTDFLATVLTKGSAGTIERAFWQTLKIAALTDGEVAGTPTATEFDTNLTNTSGAFDHLLLVFVSGALEGEARPIESYVSTNGRIVLQEALTAAPSVADEFVVVPDHSEPVAEGESASANEIWGALLSNYSTPGTFGARFQEADRYTNTTSQIVYLNQGDAYDDTANNAVQWEVTKDYAAADSLTLTIEHRVTGATLLTHAATYVDATTIKAFLSSSDTAFALLTTDADFGVHPYRLVADFSGETQTIVNGAASIART